MRRRSGSTYCVVVLIALSFSVICCSSDQQGHEQFQQSHEQDEQKKFDKKTTGEKRFGRVLTWNVKKLNPCLDPEHTDQRNEAICAILLSANVVALQEALNMDFSCLPCKKDLTEQYQVWEDEIANDFKLLIKTREKTLLVKTYGTCTVSDDVPGKRSHVTTDTSQKDAIYNAVMQRLKVLASNHNEHSKFSTRHRVDLNSKAPQNQPDVQRLPSKQPSKAEARTDHSVPSSDIYGSVADVKNIQSLIEEVQNTPNLIDDAPLHQIPLGRAMPNAPSSSNILQNVPSSRNIEKTPIVDFSKPLDDMHPIASSILPEQDASYYDKDWIGENVLGFETIKQKSLNDQMENLPANQEGNFNKLGFSEHENMHVQLNFHLNDTTTGKGILTSDTDAVKVEPADTNTTFSTNKESKYNSPKAVSKDNNSQRNVSHFAEKESKFRKKKLMKIKTNIDIDENAENDHVMARFHQDDISQDELIRERLYKFRERLYNVSRVQKETERFRSINKQLNGIEREIGDLEGDIYEQRFHVNDDDTGEGMNSSLLSIDDKNTRFHLDNETNYINSTNSTKHPEKISNRFHNENSNASKKTQHFKPDKNFQYLNLEETHQPGSSRDRINFADSQVVQTMFPRPNQKTFANQHLHVRRSIFPLLNQDVLQQNNRHRPGPQFSSDQNLERSKLKGLRSPGYNKKDSIEKSLTRCKRKRSELCQELVNTPELLMKAATKLDKNSGRAYVQSKGNYANSSDLYNHGFSNAMKKTATLKATNVNYAILLFDSNLVFVNVKLPISVSSQRGCIRKIMSDISNTNSESMQKKHVFILGDFHFDHLSGSDKAGFLYKLLTSLQIDGEQYYGPIVYDKKDPITTIYGRRFDNVLTNFDPKNEKKTIGPGLPEDPKGVVMPLALQRLYNNYMVSLYSSENEESESIYSCIAAFQKKPKELKEEVCKDSWVPSSYISDHLPIRYKATIKIDSKSPKVEVNFGFWNIGDSFRERFQQDIAVRNKLLKHMKEYDVMLFHKYPPVSEEILDEKDIDNILRLKQSIVTNIGIYVNQDIKDGNQKDMFILYKKALNIATTPGQKGEEQITTLVTLFAPNIIVETVKLKPCLYTVIAESSQTWQSVELKEMLTEIESDVSKRRCDFKVLLASLKLDDYLLLQRELFLRRKYISTLQCELNGSSSKYKYMMPSPDDVNDYVMVLEKKDGIELDECAVELPGDEEKRGLKKLNDFEELSTHYPLSIAA